MKFNKKKIQFFSKTQKTHFQFTGFILSFFSILFQGTSILQQKIELAHLLYQYLTICV